MESKEKIFARIVAASDGFIYLLMKNYQCCSFSVECFRALLQDPAAFLSGGLKKYLSPSGYPTPLKGRVSEIPGLTLAYLTDERKLVCEYPEIISVCLLRAGQANESSHIHLSEVLGTGALLDQKQCYLEVFLALANRAGTNLLNPLSNLSAETQNRIMAEVLGGHFKANLNSKHPVADEPRSEEPTVTESAQDSTVDNSANLADIPFSLCNPPAPDDEPPVQTRKNKEDHIPEGFIKLATYATKYDVSLTAIHCWIKKQWISPMKDSGGHWWLDGNDTPDKVRERNQAGKRVGRRAPARIKGGSFEDVQKYIRDRDLFSERIRPFIRTLEEARYYAENRYREVDWWGSSALIIDVQLDYFSRRHNSTNRDLIVAGLSPVVPSQEETVFHLHHIGQRKDSPLAIIPEKVHNSQEMYSVFHPSPAADEDLHSAAFDLQRKQFWLTYLHMCDTHSGYRNVPSQKRKNA